MPALDAEMIKVDKRQIFHLLQLKQPVHEQGSVCHQRNIYPSGVSKSLICARASRTAV